MINFLNYIYNDEDLQNDITKLFNPASARHLELYHKGMQKFEKLKEKKEQLEYERLLDELSQCKSHDNILSNRQLSSSRKTDFYKNQMTWLNKVSNKVAEEKVKLNELKENEIRDNKITNPKSEHILSTNYVGPISGWQERINHYQGCKINPTTTVVFENEYKFTPQLSEQSEKITKQKKYTQKDVVERLKNFGEILEQKKSILQKEKENSEIKDAFKPKTTPYPLKSLTEKMGIVDKLFFRAEEIKKRKEEKILKELNSISFKPQILNYSLTKERPPLYPQNKAIETNETKRINYQELEEKKQKFENFLKRNSKPSEKMDNSKVMKGYMESFLKITKECTFAPQICKNSKKIMENSNNKLPLYERNTRKMNKKIEELEKIKKELEEREIAECSFIPKLYKKAKESKPETQSGVSSKKSNQINQSMNHNASLQIDQSMNQNTSLLVQKPEIQETFLRRGSEDTIRYCPDPFQSLEPHAEQQKNTLNYRSKSEDNIQVCINHYEEARDQQSSTIGSYSHHEIHKLMQIENKLGALNNLIDALLTKNAIDKESKEEPNGDDEQ